MQQYRTDRSIELSAKRQAELAMQVTVPYAARLAAAPADGAHNAKMGKKRKARKHKEKDEGKKETTNKHGGKHKKKKVVSKKWSRFEDDQQTGESEQEYYSEQEAESDQEAQDVEAGPIHSEHEEGREQAVQDIAGKRTVGKESKGGIRKQYHVRWAGKAANGKPWGLQWIDEDRMRQLHSAKVEEFERQDEERRLTEEKRIAEENAKKASQPSVDKIYADLVKKNPRATQYQYHVRWAGKAANWFKLICALGACKARQRNCTSFISHR